MPSQPPDANSCSKPIEPQRESLLAGPTPPPVCSKLTNAMLFNPSADFVSESVERGIVQASMTRERTHALRLPPNSRLGPNRCVLSCRGRLLGDQMGEYERIRVMWPDHLGLARGKYLPKRYRAPGHRALRFSVRVGL